MSWNPPTHCVHGAECGSFHGIRKFHGCQQRVGFLRSRAHLAKYEGMATWTPPSGFDSFVIFGAKVPFQTLYASSEVTFPISVFMKTPSIGVTSADTIVTGMFTLVYDTTDCTFVSYIDKSSFVWNTYMRTGVGMQFDFSTGSANGPAIHMIDVHLRCVPGNHRIGVETQNTADADTVTRSASGIQDSSLGRDHAHVSKAHVLIETRQITAILAYPDQGRSLVRDVRILDASSSATVTVYADTRSNDPTVSSRTQKASLGTCTSSSGSVLLQGSSCTLTAPPGNSDSETVTIALDVSGSTAEIDIHIRRPSSLRLEIDDTFLTRTSCSIIPFQSTSVRVFAQDHEVTQLTRFHSTNFYSCHRGSLDRRGDRARSRYDSYSGRKSIHGTSRRRDHYNSSHSRRTHRTDFVGSSCSKLYYRVEQGIPLCATGIPGR